MNTRRILITIVLTTLAVMMLAGTALAESSPKDKLMAAFNTFANAGDTIVYNVPNYVALEHAAPVTGFDRKISPFSVGQEFCDDTVLGTWASIWFWDEEMDFIKASYVEITLDRQMLELDRTPIKRAFPTIHDGTKYWWYAQGVPVLGTLDEGTHSLFTSLYIGEYIYEFDITFEILSCTE